MVAVPAARRGNPILGNRAITRHQKQLGVDHALLHADQRGRREVGGHEQIGAGHDEVVAAPLATEIDREVIRTQVRQTLAAKPITERDERQRTAPAEPVERAALVTVVRCKPASTVGQRTRDRVHPRRVVAIAADDEHLRAV
ncbi:MAG TPA: hypothetical protein VFP84_32595 [Kofleriaceae bacterium]|nr:hypothetical protein [Kofleriaceae bacterium]